MCKPMPTSVRLYPAVTALAPDLTSTLDARPQTARYPSNIVSKRALAWCRRLCQSMNTISLLKLNVHCQ